LIAPVLTIKSKETKHYTQQKYKKKQTEKPASANKTN